MAIAIPKSYGEIKVVYVDERVERRLKDKEKLEAKIKKIESQIKKISEKTKLAKVLYRLTSRKSKKKGNAALVGSLVTTILMLVMGLIIVAHFYGAAPPPTDTAMNETFVKGKEMTQKSFNLAWLIPIGLVAAALIGFITRAFNQ